MTATAEQVTAAYRHCEVITRTQARNFSYGITLLPGAKRRALSAVYAFARRVDDIGDGELPAPQKLAALRAARASLAAIGSLPPAAGPAASAVTPEAAAPGVTGSGAAATAPAPDLVVIALADAARRFPIPLAAFGELIDGCEADVRGTSYSTFGELEHYCRCVAGSIGRLSLGVFGCRDVAAAEPLADALGVALQLTNILRDIREDLTAGRVYLPADDLKQFGCALSPAPDPAGELRNPDGASTALANPALADLVQFEARRAAGWYATGMALMPQLDRRSRACTGAMAGIYLRLLERIAAAPRQALATRMSLPARTKALVAARCLAGLPDRVPVTPPAPVAGPEPPAGWPA